MDGWDEAPEQPWAWPRLWLLGVAWHDAIAHAHAGGASLHALVPTCCCCCSCGCGCGGGCMPAGKTMLMDLFVASLAQRMAAAAASQAAATATGAHGEAAAAAPGAVASGTNRQPQLQPQHGASTHNSTAAALHPTPPSGLPQPPGAGAGAPAPAAFVTRRHFHEFMLAVHSRLHALQQRLPRALGHSRQGLPVYRQAARRPAGEGHGALCGSWLLSACLPACRPTLPTRPPPCGTGVQRDERP